VLVSVIVITTTRARTPASAPVPNSLQEELAEQ